MKRKNFLAAVAMILLISLALCACGKKEADVDGPAQGENGPVTVTAWTLTPETWSSPNGATIHLSAEMSRRDDAVTGEFVVRQGDADVVNAPCTWDGNKLLAEAELNAADGYSYFVVLTAADGSLTECPLGGADASLVNLASALNSYCNVVVGDSDYSNKTLTLTAGSVEIRVPQITDDGAAITCKEVSLVLTMDGEELTRTAVAVSSTEVSGGFEADLAGTTFSVPAMDDDGQVLLRLEVSLSNGQSLSAEGGTWTYMDGQIISTVG